MRALLITGGHDHETSFYSLFEGYKDLARAAGGREHDGVSERLARQV